MKPEWVLVVSIRLVNFLLREKERNISYQYQVWKMRCSYKLHRHEKMIKEYYGQLFVYKLAKRTKSWKIQTNKIQLRSRQPE